MFRRKTQPSPPPVAALRARTVAVDIDLSELAAGTPPPDSGWLESSRDLQRGVRVRETAMHSLPPELIDALLRRRL